jgi:hypothetical protein
VHVVFTLPHELNTLARLNPRIMYNNIMRSSWQTIKRLSSKGENLGGLPGMVSVLHTFGSDMKYHVHVHGLVTFGGLDEQGKWQWPKRKKKIASFRKMCATYKEIFLKMLTKQIKNKELKLVNDIDQLLEQVSTKRWNVRNQYPTADTEVLTRYLARYINRIAISKSRLEYVAEKEKADDVVNITYKDYRKQKQGSSAPLAIKSMHPLVAIDQFLKHVLPSYFQKSRYYGIHNHSTYETIKDSIPKKLKRNAQTIRILFAIINYLSGLSPQRCEACNGAAFSSSPISVDHKWIFQFITIPSYRGPPQTKITKLMKT